MAKSPSHALGQIIGFAMEEAVYDILKDISRDYSLYLDKQGPRNIRKGLKKVTWIDYENNKHDLDFVLEKDGDNNKKGSPIAFIECAWRRYTKHSVNKAGEICNALVPLRETYKDYSPFLGVIVAGEWTSGGLSNMRQKGINIVHITTDVIVEAFKCVNINVFFNENTDSEKMNMEVQKYNKLSDKQKEDISSKLIELSYESFQDFKLKIASCFCKKIVRVLIVPLYGEEKEAYDIRSAIQYIEDIGYESFWCKTMKKIEIQLEYNNGDTVKVFFSNKINAIDYLNKYL